jgi:uncharacterized protein HemX
LLSGTPPDNTVGSENPLTPPQHPAIPPAYTTPTAQQVACPNCYTLVSAGTRYCPQCGNAIPPPTTWPGVPAPAPAPRRNTALIIVAIVLIALLVAGVGGYIVYQQGQQRVLQAAKNSEANAANQAVQQLQFTCSLLASQPEPTTLPYTTRRLAFPDT